MRNGSPAIRLRTAGVVLLAGFAACGLQAQTPDSHAQLAAVLAPEEELEADFRREIEIGLPAELSADPDFAGFERECPGAVEGVMAALQIGPWA